MFRCALRCSQIIDIKMYLPALFRPYFFAPVRYNTILCALRKTLYHTICDKINNLLYEQVGRIVVELESAVEIFDQMTSRTLITQYYDGTLESACNCHMGG